MKLPATSDELAEPSNRKDGAKHPIEISFATSRTEAGAPNGETQRDCHPDRQRRLYRLANAPCGTPRTVDKVADVCDRHRLVLRVGRIS